MNVKQLLHTMGPRELVKVSPDAIVIDAAKLMEDKDVGALLVMEEAKLLGIVSERDLVRKIMTKELNPESTSVRVVMTENPTVIGLFAQLEDCEGIMNMMHVRHCRSLMAAKSSELSLYETSSECQGVRLPSLLNNTRNISTVPTLKF